MQDLEAVFQRLKAYDSNDKIELYISAKILRLKGIKTYDELGLKYNRYNNREATNGELLGAMETLYTNSIEEWLEHRQKVMTTYVKLIGAKERLLHKEIERERSLF